MIRGNAVVVAMSAALTTALGLVAAPAADAGSGRFVRIQAGTILCDVLYQEVFCGYPPGFPTAPPDPVTGRRPGLVVVETSGRLKWRTDDLRSYPDPEITLDDRQAYHMYGWVIQPDAAGTRFISDFTAHGMVISTDDVRPF